MAVAARTATPSAAADDSAAHVPAQFMVGAVFGCVGGYMDNVYSEPFYIIFGGALLTMQALDYTGTIKFGWNPGTGSAGLAGFVGDNMAVAGGFATGYFLGYNLLEWANAVKESFEEGAEEAEGSSPA